MVVAIADEEVEDNILERCSTCHPSSAPDREYDIDAKTCRQIHDLLDADRLAATLNLANQAWTEPRERGQIFLGVAEFFAAQPDYPANISSIENPGFGGWPILFLVNHCHHASWSNLVK
jgi:hypothetical protein